MRRCPKCFRPTQGGYLYCDEHRDPVRVTDLRRAPEPISERAEKDVGGEHYARVQPGQWTYGANSSHEIAIFRKHSVADPVAALARGEMSSTARELAWDQKANKSTDWALSVSEWMDVNGQVLDKLLDAANAWEEAQRR